MIQDIKPSLPSFMRIPNGLLDGQRKKAISTASAFTARVVDIETDLYEVHAIQSSSLGGNNITIDKHQTLTHRGAKRMNTMMLRKHPPQNRTSKTVEDPIVAILVNFMAKDTFPASQAKAARRAPMIRNSAQMSGDEFGPKPFESHEITLNNSINIRLTASIVEEECEASHKESLKIIMRL